MARFLYHDLANSPRRGGSLLLAFFWCAGLVLGVIVSVSAGEPLTSLMLPAVTSRVSFFSLLSTAFLPFLFSAFAVFIHAPVLMVGISFLKAFFYSFVSCCVMRWLDGAGWLIQGMLMFSDICFLPMLYWFWLQFLSGDRKISAAPFLMVAAMGILAISIDFAFISSLLHGMTDILKG